MAPGGLQPAGHQTCQAFHELVAERRIGVALGPQAGAVERRGANALPRTGIELVHVGREQPRPAQDLTLAKRLERDRATRGNVGLDGDAAAADREEPVRCLAFTQEIRARVEVDVLPAPGDEGEVLRLQTFEERVP